MTEKQKAIEGKSIESRWNGLDYKVHQHDPESLDHFWLWLITNDDSQSDGGLGNGTGIHRRPRRPTLFHNINLKDTLYTQTSGSNLRPLYRRFFVKRAWKRYPMYQLDPIRFQVWTF